MNLLENSKQMMNFFTKNEFINNTTQTKNTNKIVNNLYKDMYESFQYLNAIKQKEKQKEKYITFTTKQIVNASQITKPKNFHINSFPDLVRKQIHSFTSSEIVYKFSLFGREINIFFIVDEPLNKVNIDTYNNYMDAIIMWLYIINKHSSKKCVKTLCVYLYLTSLKKMFPEPNNILNEINVNTAFTTTCPKDSEIVIFRKEEWFKVFIHESFHNFGLDFSDMNNVNIHNYILNIFKVNSKVNLYESYTECWAEIINALFCSFYTIKNKSNVQEFLSYSEFFINLERTYSFIQLVKTLDFLKLSYQDLYVHSQENREKYKENTNVLAYYIIKTVLMNNYQGFLHWCVVHNNEFVLQFKQTITNQKEFCKFIYLNYKTTSMIKNVKLTQIFLDNLHKKKNKNNKLDYILNNLRMSICELG
jgi:hypothetical protein